MNNSRISRTSSINLTSVENKYLELDLKKPDIRAVVKCGIELKDKIATGLNDKLNHAIHERLNKIAEDIYDIVKDRNNNKRDTMILLNKYRNEIIRLCITQKACHSVNIKDITNFIKICTLLPDYSDYQPQTKWFHLFCCKDIDQRLKELISNESSITETITEKTNIDTYLKDIYNVNKYMSNYEWTKIYYVDLRNANLEQNSYNLPKMFYNCNFANVVFEEEPRIEVHIENSAITSCSFKETKIIGSRFINCDFGGANFGNSKIVNSSLRGKIIVSTVNNAIFTDAQFNNTIIDGEFSQADFRNVKFVKCDFMYTLCNSADFSGSEFNECRISGDFSKANFDSVKFYLVSLLGSNFDNATFKNVTEFTLKISDNLDLEFNHINNDRSGSILTAIHSIDYIYHELKNNLMIQVFQFLEKKDISSIIDALVDIFFNRDKKEYYADAFSAVPGFVEKLFTSRKEQGNNGILRMSEKEIKFHLDFIERYAMYKESNFLHLVTNESGYNAFLMQLRHRVQQFKHFKWKTNQFYINYLETIGFCAAKTEEGELMTSVIDATYAIKEAIYDDDIMLLVSDQDIIIVGNDYYKQALSEKDLSSFNWNNIVYFQCTRRKDPENPHTIYKNVPVTSLDDIAAFRIFLAKYKFEREKNTFKNLIRLLNLGEYEKNFLNAILNNRSATKYIDLPHQQKLFTIFGKLFDGTKTIFDIKVDTLKISHIDKILETYGFDKKPTNEQAQLLLLLSGIFAKYSSSRIFGTEDNSPYPLRRYAAGLLAAAVQKYEDIVSTAQLQNWINRLLGAHNAYQCTAVLSEIIIEYCKKFPEYLKLLGGIIPSAWNN